MRVGGGQKKKMRRTPGPGALLVHSDFSLKIRALALRSSNPPENLFAPDDSHFLCVLWPAGHRLPPRIQTYRSLRSCVWLC